MFCNEEVDTHKMVYIILKKSSLLRCDKVKNSTFTYVYYFKPQMVCISSTIYLPISMNFFDIYRGLLELVGIIVGHLYFFLMFKYPQDFGGARLLSVPNIL